MNPASHAALLVTLVAVAHARPATADAKVDWGAGFVVARGIGVANRAAPTPAAARGPSRRAAEEAARREIRTALPALPLARGGTLATALKDAKVKAAIDAALASSTVTIAAEPETDGSWTVTLGLPVEAIRQATTTPRALIASDDALPVVIVEGVATKPAIGYRIGSLDAATVWMSEVPTWADKAPRVKARSVANGAITATLPAKATAATLFVLMR